MSRYNFPGLQATIEELRAGGQISGPPVGQTGARVLLASRVAELLSMACQASSPELADMHLRQARKALDLADSALMGATAAVESIAGRLVAEGRASAPTAGEVSNP